MKSLSIGREGKNESHSKSQHVSLQRKQPIINEQIGLEGFNNYNIF